MLTLMVVLETDDTKGVQFTKGRSRSLTTLQAGSDFKEFSLNDCLALTQICLIIVCIWNDVFGI